MHEMSLLRAGRQKSLVFLVGQKFESKEQGTILIVLLFK